MIRRAVSRDRHAILILQTGQRGAGRPKPARCQRGRPLGVVESGCDAIVTERERERWGSDEKVLGSLVGVVCAFRTPLCDATPHLECLEAYNLIRLQKRQAILIFCKNEGGGGRTDDRLLTSVDLFTGPSLHTGPRWSQQSGFVQNE